MRGRYGVYPYRVAAGGGASPGHVVGISGDRLFRAILAIRSTDRLHVLRGPVSPSRTWRSHRLGPGSLSQGCAWPGPFRWLAPVRTRRPPAGGAPRLGNAHFQLWTPRSSILPCIERSLLARLLSHRRSKG